MAHKVDWSSKPGFFRFSANSRYFKRTDIDELLVSKYGYDPAEVSNYCHAAGLDTFGGAAMCPCSWKSGHETSTSKWHCFPVNFAEDARKLLPKY